MLQSIFSWLSNAMDAAPHAALTAAFLWGLLSILLSPCHLASIPLFVGFLQGGGNISIRRAFGLSTVFSGAILLSIAVIGLITSLAGRMLGDIGSIGNIAIAIVFFAIGLLLLDVIRLPAWSTLAQKNVSTRRYRSAFVLGLIFGAAVGPCTFAFMAPVLGVVIRTASIRFGFAIALILFYALGHCSVIILAGTFTGAVQKYLDWNERSRGAVIIKKGCGVLVIAGGIYLLLHL